MLCADVKAESNEVFKLDVACHVSTANGTFHGLLKRGAASCPKAPFSYFALIFSTAGKMSACTGHDVNIEHQPRLRTSLAAAR